MRKQRNKRGKITRTTFTQTIKEPEFIIGLDVKRVSTKNFNPRYPKTKTIFHRLIG